MSEQTLVVGTTVSMDDSGARGTTNVKAVADASKLAAHEPF